MCFNAWIGGAGVRGGYGFKEPTTIGSDGSMDTKY
jgi:hypothetical protein